MTLSMYYNGSDTIIAESIDDAKLIWKETTGDDWNLYAESEEIEEWKIKHKDSWTVIFEDLDDVENIFSTSLAYESKKSDNGYYSIKATEQDWISYHGRGWFCTENW